jgi:hypothetical protein
VAVRAIEIKAASGASGYLEILSVACPSRQADVSFTLSSTFRRAVS